MKKPKIGRPRKYNTVEELEERIQEYFDSCFDEDGEGEMIEPFTVTGLGLALGLTRQGLLNYEGREEFVDTIKRAKQIVENFAERRLFGNNPTGAIFALKNYNWTDRQDINFTDKTETLSDEELDRRIEELMNKTK